MGTIPVQPSHASDAVDHNKQCIFCLEEKPLTIEHVFPESIGGRLKIPFVCEDCNSKLGSTVDGKFQALFPFILNRQLYGLKGKNGYCPKAFSGDWEVEDPSCRIRRVRLVEDRVEALPETQIKEIPNGMSVSMAIPATLSLEQQRGMIEKTIRRTLLNVNPQLKNVPNELDRLVNSEVDRALHEATLHSVQPMLHQNTTLWSDVGVQEYVKIAYELAFCLYGYHYITKSNTASILRKAVFSGGEALKSVCRYVPFDFPNANDPFPDRELFFWIGEGRVFVRMFGVGGMIQVLMDNELIVFPPIDTYLSKLVANSPDVQKDDARCLWGAKLPKRDD